MATTQVPRRGEERGPMSESQPWAEASGDTLTHMCTHTHTRMPTKATTVTHTARLITVLRGEVVEVALPSFAVLAACQQHNLHVVCRSLCPGPNQGVWGSVPARFLARYAGTVAHPFLGPWHRFLGGPWVRGPPAGVAVAPVLRSAPPVPPPPFRPPPP